MKRINERRNVMIARIHWLGGQLSIALALAVTSVIGTVTTAGAHAGNTDPNAIHACVNNASGATKIVGITGSCTPGETAVHWGIVGPRGPQGAMGPQGPSGTVASFDDLAGLSCTRDGSVGTTTILYAANGDATVRCVLPQPPPGTDLSGIYSLGPEIHFSCALGFARFDISTFAFSLSGSQLTVDGAPRSMSGSVNGNTFSVQGSGSFNWALGTVMETYSLSGTYDAAAGTWSGTFQALFQGFGVDIGGCGGQSYAIQGTRQ